MAVLVPPLSTASEYMGVCGEGEEEEPRTGSRVLANRTLQGEKETFACR